MAFLQGVAPIVRGECDACGMSRNLWVTELGAGPSGVPCRHGDRGCRGVMQIVYRGPKAWMPSEYDHGWCNCDGVHGAPGSGGSASSSAGGEALGQLKEMGFEQERALQALARSGGDVAAALDLLMDPAAAAAAEADAAAPTCGSCSPALEDAGECAICCEELARADAAMRCNGHGGKKHYFHAQCLTAWVRECRRAGNAPTCPECRGPVQVRPRRLEEFLRQKGQKLDREDQEALRQIREAAGGEVDCDGWSDVRAQLLTAGAIVGVGVVAAIAVAGLVKALSGPSSSDRRREDPQ